MKLVADVVVTITSAEGKKKQCKDKDWNYSSFQGYFTDNDGNVQFITINAFGNVCEKFCEVVKPNMVFQLSGELSFYTYTQTSFAEVENEAISKMIKRMLLSNSSSYRKTARIINDKVYLAVESPVQKLSIKVTSFVPLGMNPNKMDDKDLFDFDLEDEENASSSNTSNDEPEWMKAAKASGLFKDDECPF